MSLLNYLFTILKINYLVLGGASLTAPFYFRYYVETNIIPEQEINHYLAMSNILPGAMSIYMTAYTGLYLHGKKGMYLGLCILFIPITLLSILILEFASKMPFDLELLMYISLPIMIVACIDYVVNVFKSNIDRKFKYGVFIISLFALSFAILGTIQIILIYIAIIWFLTRGGNNATNINN